MPYRRTIAPTPKYAYAFGSGIKERTASFTKKYRFGFNNQEQETELGEYYGFEYRVHDARLGRFLSVDPLAQKFAFATPFNFAKNKPIQFIDFLGCAEADPAKPGAQGVVQSGWGLWTFCQQYGIKGSNFIEQADALIQANRVSFPGYPADGSLKEKQEFINSNKCSIYPNQALYLPKGTKVNTYIDAVPGVQYASIAGGYYKENGLNAQLGKAPIVYGKQLYIPNTPNNLTSLSNKSSEPLGEFGFTKSEPSSAAQSGGGDWMNKTQTGLGAFDLAHGAKEELINYAAKSSPAINEMQYVKAMKVASKGLFGAQAVISGVQVYNAWDSNNSNKWGVTGKAGLDVTIGYISLVGGPVGWGVGAVYFIGDAAGWWGNWGQAAPSPLDINKR